MAMPIKYLLTASRLTPLITLLYVIVVDRLQNELDKRPDEETTLELSRLAREVLPVWEQAVPSLREAILNILKGYHKQDTYEHLGAVLKKLAPQGRSDIEIPTIDLELMNSLSAYFRTDSQAALVKVMKFAALTKSPWVVQRLVPKIGTQQATKTALETLVESLVGRKDTTLTSEESVLIKETKPESHKAYRALRTDFNKAWKDECVAFIRRSGKDKVLYEELIDYLKLNGIEHLMPTGIIGYIDDVQKVYTMQDKPIEGVPSAVIFPTVLMNKTFGRKDGGDWVFMAIRADGSNGPYYYTMEYKKAQSLIKFEHVKILATKMQSMRNKWFANVKNFDITKPNCVTAVVLEILYEFAARIGSVGNKANGQPTYGIGTLLVKHAIIMPDGNITLSYKGKKGVAAKHKILQSDPHAKYVLLALHQLLADKDKNERIFTYLKGGKHKILSPADVNAEFKACGAPGDVTVHKIRTYLGTDLFNKLMAAQFAKPKQPKTEKEALEIFTKIGEAVGKLLNHVRTVATGGTKVTGTTAIANYIDISSLLLYWHTLEIRVPTSLEKFAAELEKNGDD